jgi:hypothetical protein
MSNIFRFISIVVIGFALSGCDSPIGVSSTNTERAGLTKEEAIVAAKQMSIGKGKTVNIVIRPYGYLSRIATEIAPILCNNELVKLKEYNVETGRLTLEGPKDKHIEKFRAYNFHVVGSWQSASAFRLETEGAYPVLAEALKDQNSLLYTVAKEASRCEFMSMINRAVTPRPSWEIRILDRGNKKGKTQYMNMKLTEAWHTSRHFNILATQIEQLTRPTYSDMYDLFIAYIMDDEIIEKGLLDTREFHDLDRNITADLTGTGSVRFSTTDGFIFDTKETGSAQLMLMGSPWLNANYLEGRDMSIQLTYSNTLEMVKASTDKNSEVGVLISEVASKVGI